MMIKYKSPNPFISVIMATYNDGEYLEEAIISILNQTYSNFEFIIIDDSSTDTTAEILTRLSKVDDRIKLILNEHNIGLAGSLNKGLEIAQGEWIARMDGDDISEHNRFEIQMEHIIENNLIYLGTGAKLIKKGTNKFIGYQQEPLTHGLIAWKLIYASPFVHATTIGRKDAIISAGGYNSKLPRYEDVDLWRRLIFYGPCANLPDYLYTYRRSEPKRKLESIEKIIYLTHQKYIQSLINKDVSREVIRYLCNKAKIDDVIFEINPFEILEILTGSYQSIKKMGWFLELDYPIIENQLLDMMKYLPLRSEKMMEQYVRLYWGGLEKSAQEKIYWNHKDWPKILRNLGLLFNSPKGFIQKLDRK